MNNYIGTDIGRYHIIEQLGQGGMATVYKAFDTRLERNVAIKVIRRDAFSPEMLERVLARFDREAKTLAKLTHPNIVGIIDYGEHEGSPYLVMPFLAGGTLKDRMGSPLPYPQAAALLKPIADALAYAHQHDVIHRDVKPANILLTESGQPMLSDFGVASLLENESGSTLTGTGVGVGTPEYMAPEQGLGKKVDARADIYALAVVFYELLTGHKPYTADTPMAVVLKQMTDPLPRPTEYVMGLPEQVERLLFKALAKDPAERYQEMSEVTNILDTLSGGTVASTPQVMGNTSPTIGRDEYVTGTATMDLQSPYLRPQPAPAPLPSSAGGETMDVTLPHREPLYNFELPQTHRPEGGHFPTWGWVLIGIGGLGLLIILVASLGTHPATPAVAYDPTFPPAAVAVDPPTAAPTSVPELPTYTPYPTYTPLPTFTVWPTDPPTLVPQPTAAPAAQVGFTTVDITPNRAICGNGDLTVTAHVTDPSSVNYIMVAYRLMSTSSSGQLSDPYYLHNMSYRGGDEYSVVTDICEVQRVPNWSDAYMNFELIMVTNSGEKITTFPASTYIDW